VPAEAHAELQLRLVSEVAPVKTLLEDAIDGRAEVEYWSEHEPVRMQSIAGFEQCVVRFTTDIPYLSGWGKPLLLGPGSILNAHTDHESVEKHELEEAVKLYVGLVRALLGAGKQAIAGIS
jgi:acetylornithine deacetylase